MLSFRYIYYLRAMRNQNLGSYGKEIVLYRTSWALWAKPHPMAGGHFVLGPFPTLRKIYSQGQESPDGW